jgi:hypothetical protein
LRAWYDPDGEPVMVGTPADLDACLDRLAADRVTMRVPPLMQLARRDSDGWAVLHVGVDVDRGVLVHTDATGSFVAATGDDAGEPVTYDYLGHVRTVAGNAEIPLADVRRAAHEFVATGARPTCVAWQPDR